MKSTNSDNITVPTPPSGSRGVKFPLGDLGVGNMYYGAMPILFEFAKQMRSNQTEAEAVLWQYLSNNQRKGFRFKRQHPIKYFIADFYCHSKKIIIEIDGGYHQISEQYEYDRNRDYELEELGLKVLHFTNEQVLFDIENTIKMIDNELSHSLPLNPLKGEKDSNIEHSTTAKSPLGDLGVTPPSGGRGAKILIADDEPVIRRMLCLLLKDEGYEVKAVENGKEAVDALLQYRPDLVLLDQQMPVMTGVEALENIKSLNPSQIVVLMTAFGSISLAVDAVKKGAYDFIEKPFDNDKLILTVNRSIEHCQMRKEITVLHKRLSATRQTIVGESFALKQLLAQIQKAAKTDVTVLIYGESGTGKELIAKTLHENSARSEKPFVAVNCGAIPFSLMESELFGHEKGAFTDAKEARPGIFEQANGGTLFLDEIGELHIDAQVKLLRILEDRKVTRIGSKKSIPVDVRIVAATNRNLEEEVLKNRFRLDLLYRLNVFVAHIPPLRERKEDIPLLVDFFISRYNQLLNMKIQSISKEAIDYICAHHWPGNIRDLENAIQSAMILSPDGIIRPEQLPLRVKGYLQETATAENETMEHGIKEINAQVERELILDALKKNKYNRTLTASALNISRKTLFNKMRRYGLEG